MICTIIKSGTINKQDAWVIGWGGYFVNLVKRGKRLECTGVYSLEFDNFRLEPRICYQPKRLKNTQEIMKAVKTWFNALDKL